jgi:hypothetical protein
MEKSDREKQIDLFLSQLESQEEYNIKRKNIIKQLINQYQNELEDYYFIDTINDYNNMDNGGYVRYFNLNKELKWGGILIKKIKQNDMDMMILSNSNCDRFAVSFRKNYIFYKNHTTQADKTRKLFLSYLDKYN